MKKIMLFVACCTSSFLMGHCGNCPGDRCTSCMNKNFAACTCTGSCLCAKVGCGCMSQGCCGAQPVKKSCGWCGTESCRCVEGQVCTHPRCAVGSSETSTKVPLRPVLGQQVRITLPTHASSGYSWEFKKPLSSKLKLVDTVSVAGKMPGAPGLVTYVFDTLATGGVTVHMQEIRPWEKGKGGKPMDERSFRVVIQKK